MTKADRIPRRRHRHLSRITNRAIVPALVEAIDRMEPEHPDYDYWQERRHMLAVAAEVV